MDAPLDEYALDNFDPAAQRLVKEMLAAVVNHPSVHENLFRAERMGEQPGYKYFLGRKGGGTSPFQQNQILPHDIVEPLLHAGFVTGARVTNVSSGWSSFTDAAIEWHRRYGGPSADDIRKAIGRALYLQEGPRWHPRDFDFAGAAEQLGVSVDRVQFEMSILMGAGLVYRRYAGSSAFGVVQLTRPEGIRWAAGRFPPVGSLDAPIVNVDVRVEVSNVIQQARAAEVDPNLLERFEARLRRVEEEFEKPPGDGRFQTVKDVVETANNSKDLLAALVPFLARHVDKIQALADAAGNMS